MTTEVAAADSDSRSNIDTTTRTAPATADQPVIPVQDHTDLAGHTLSAHQIPEAVAVVPPCADPSNSLSRVADPSRGADISHSVNYEHSADYELGPRVVRSWTGETALLTLGAKKRPGRINEDGACVVNSELNDELVTHIVGIDGKGGENGRLARDAICEILPNLLRTGMEIVPALGITESYIAGRSRQEQQQEAEEQQQDAEEQRQHEVSVGACISVAKIVHKLASGRSGVSFTKAGNVRDILIRPSLLVYCETYDHTLTNQDFSIGRSRRNACITDLRQDATPRGEDLRARNKTLWYGRTVATRSIGIVDGKTYAERQKAQPEEAETAALEKGAESPSEDGMCERFPATGYRELHRGDVLLIVSDGVTVALDSSDLVWETVVAIKSFGVALEQPAAPPGLAAHIARHLFGHFSKVFQHLPAGDPCRQADDILFGVHVEQSGRPPSRIRPNVAELGRSSVALLGWPPG